MNQTPITIDTLLQGARTNPGRVVVPCAHNEEALEAIVMALKDGVVCGGTLLGPRAAIEETARKVGLSLGAFQIIETSTDADAASQAVRLIANGEGDFLLKGQIDTKIYLKAILDKEVGLVPPGNTLTHVALIHIPSYHKLLISTDAAILIEPSLEDKAKEVQNAIDFAHRLGITTPKVAMLAAVEKVNPKMISTVHADEIVKMHKAGKFANSIVEGPYDIYIATSAEAAKVKKVSGEVCGDADVLVFHEINSANSFYKSIQRFVPNSWAAGLIAGARIPILLPSRADDAETKRMSILVAAYMGGRK